MADEAVTRAERLRPLKRGAFGVWESRDGRWQFAKHHSDPHPQRWFAYFEDDERPCNEGEGHTTLRAVVAWAETAEPSHD